MKEKGDIKPIIVKVGFALAVSLASLVYSRLRLRPRRSSDNGNGSDSSGKDEKKMASVSSETHPFVRDSPKNDRDGDRNVSLFPELDDLIKEFDISEDEINTSEGFVESEIADLRDTVTTLRERESALEAQLLEFHRLREQASSVAELRNQLKLNAMEAKLLSLKIESLRAENRRLQAQVADKARLGAELDAARAKIRHLKERLGVEASKNKEQILSLKQRVSKFENDEYESLANNSDVLTKLKRLMELEGQIEELNHSNSILRLENSDLTRKLESPEVKMGDRARKENEELKSEIEQLQAERCSEIEELVYLRWINACLRYELRDYHRPGDGKATEVVARDLSKSLSPKSEEKAKQLIMEYANTELDFDYFGSGRWSSSLTDSGAEQQGGSSSSSSSEKANHSSTGKRFFDKLLRVVRGKEEPGEEDPPRPTTLPRRSLDLPTMRNLKDQSELLKYAEALNRSRRGSLQLHKKSASFGF